MATSLLTRVKARVDLHTSNRARGLIQGRGRSMFKGSGEDFDDLKYYQPGDKISDIDWKATARSGEPLIRQFNEERVRHLSIVADTSSSMAATAAARIIASRLEVPSAADDLLPGPAERGP